MRQNRVLANAAVESECFILCYMRKDIFRLSMYCALQVYMNLNPIVEGNWQVKKRINKGRSARPGPTSANLSATFTSRHGGSANTKKMARLF